MIWLYWSIFVVIDAVMHWYIIEWLHYDPTPDGQKWWQSIPETGFRVLAFAGLWWWVGIHTWIGTIALMFGCLAIHLAWFAVVLNGLRDVKLYYLGIGWWDTLLYAIGDTLRQRLYRLTVFALVAIIIYYL